MQNEFLCRSSCEPICTKRVEWQIRSAHDEYEFEHKRPTHPTGLIDLDDYLVWRMFTIGEN